VRDYHTIWKNIDDACVLEEIFVDIGIDILWLDYLDRKYLEIIFKNFRGGPVW
jgi:Holliday junction resolvasome RuvABC ATP-dependent DNA helicase subunit